MFKTLKNAMSIPEMRRKILYTLFIILLYRIGAAIHVPYTNYEAMKSAFNIADGNLFAYLNILSGDAFSKATLFALSISPYITSSIVIQLLTIAIPALERKSKQGEEGQKFLTQLTRIVTVVLAFLTAFGYYMYMNNAGVLNEVNFGFKTQTGNNVFRGFVVVFCYAAGASLIMWLAEKINEKGIGNGISMILFANIIASTAGGVSSLIQYALGGAWKLVLVEVLLFLALVIVAFVVFITNSERRLPVQYAKKQVGRKMYGGQSTTLPIKLNMSGVMPIIFASSIVSIPSTIEMIIASRLKPGGFWEKFFHVLSYNSPVYAILFFLLIIAFAYFYILISFNPIEVANNLKKNGGFIPGYRPGKPTSDYITKVLNRITLIGALFLGIIAVAPLIVNMATGGTQLGSIAFGGSSLLILVGVILETERELEAQMSMRHYKGFLDK